ncbi:hypothetical protein TMatcc_005995 [Talaromyces marneffei ATCC 18224]|uniref:DUF829 domain protein (PaxU) n=2 Tax=Talaromyces marneffei TaxID=37727 RepID=B6Q8G7_TALMQ|nr:uncharacterized protein EYB26_005511 [Talaromyces marneffei]EEA25771.1 conserved hypothetical protein [Talaromyces marneffei ATCC 18224]KAE8554468.1 hypothetical protein EYB25_003007 [Talaromyces marneffei]QGA17835.1 hypothetical protein EYB26_005511 [Talaromyces marneffei]
MAALSDFSRVNEIVLVRSPAGDDQSSPSADGVVSSRSSSKTLAGATAPETILLLSWGDAASKHIEKYTNMYSKLYPGAKIILVRGGVADFLYRSESTQRKLVAPAVKILSESADESTLLVHVMSNAGSKSWSTISKSYLESTGRPLSNAATILDSAPGRWRFGQTWTALSRSLPRAFFPRMALSFVFGMILCVIQVKDFVTPGPDVLDTVRENLNKVVATRLKGSRRCYIYSDADDIIGTEDVEEHAKDAQQKGWAVELVKFQGSTHVGHYKQNPETYLEAIQRTWLGRSK